METRHAASTDRKKHNEKGEESEESGWELGGKTRGGAEKPREGVGGGLRSGSRGQVLQLASVAIVNSPGPFFGEGDFPNYQHGVQVQLVAKRKGDEKLKGEVASHQMT